MNDLKDAIRQYALQLGADLVGFSGIDRFDANHPRQHPASIYPGARTVIGLGFRVLRGSFRGIEEGSTFYQYYTTGVETLEEVVMPEKLLALAGLIEDFGYEAVIQKRIQP
jgi:epoxyqueuosine reductase QueG